MNWPLIIEITLKAILAMLDLGFLGCFVLFHGAAWFQVADNRREIKAGKEPDKYIALFFFAASIFSLLITVLFSWLLTIGWWAV